MALQSDLRDLARLAPFDELEPEALRLIALSAETRLLRAGTVLFRKGEPADGGFVLFNGRVALDDGRGPTTIVQPLTLIGETALLTETTRPADARAHTPASVLKVPRTLFLRVLAEYPAGAARLRTRLAERVLTLKGEYDKLHDALLR